MNATKNIYDVIVYIDYYQKMTSNLPRFLELTTYMAGLIFDP